MSYIQVKEIDSRLKGLLIILMASLFSSIYCLQAYATTNNQILINEVELNPAGTDTGTEKVDSIIHRIQVSMSAVGQSAPLQVELLL